MFSQVSLKVSVAVLAVAAVLCVPSIRAADYTGSLQGVVRNASGAHVSGAFVKFKNAERRLTFMVISQAQGRYTANNLPPGQYVVQGIGNGYQSEWSATAEVVEGRATTVDLSLTAPQAPMLPPAWPGRQPGQGGGRAAEPIPLPEGPGKTIIETRCIGCHRNPDQVASHRVNREQWKETIDGMRMFMKGSKLDIAMTDQEAAVLLDYVVENFGEGGPGAAAMAKPDPNSRLPRTLLTGEATRYIAVEYEIPTYDTEPHEVTVDSDGNGWVSLRKTGMLGRMDPRTLTYTEIAPPPGESKTVKLNAIWGGADNKLWFIDYGPNRRWLAYDTKTKEFNSFTMTTKLRTGAPGGNTMRDHPNGTVWFNAIGNNTVLRLDPKTGEFAGFEIPSGVEAGRSASPYGMAIAGDGGVWLALNAVDKVARVDPVTGRIEEFDIPVEGAVPRKGGPDSEGNVWFGLHGAGKVLKIDYKTNKMSVYTPPTENSGTYAVSVDLKHDLIWVAQQHVDKIARFNPRTETWVEFPLANAEEDHRRIEVDQSNPNRIWWSGNVSNRMGYIELLDGN